MRMRAAILVLAVLMGAPAAAQQTTGRAFTPADWYRLTTVSSPAMSPDGQLVAFAVTTVKESENERHTEVWVVPTAGGEPVRYTSPGVSSSNPRFSHDGRYLFFTSSRPGGSGSTWALRMDGPSGEAFQVNDYPNGSMPASGTFAVYTSSSGDDEEEDEEEGEPDPFDRMQATARPPFGAVTRPVDPARFDGRHVVDLGYKRNGPGYIPNPRTAPRIRPAQIWIQQVGDTAGTMLTNTAYSHRSATVSPDGRWIAFVADAQLRPDTVAQAERDSLSMLPFSMERDAERRNDSDIFIIPVAGGEPRRLTSMAGSEGSIEWSPDSRSLAFTVAEHRTENPKLYVVPAAGGEPRVVVGDDFQYGAGGVEWATPDRMLMSSAVGGRTALFEIDPRTGSLNEIVTGRRRINGFTYDDSFSKVAYVATSVDKPTELYIADIDGRNERQLTHFNAELNAEIAWPDAERFTYESVGGLEIEAWLQKPYGYDPSQKYPLVLYIHGGPHSAYGEGWFDEFHNITGDGMWVLYTNPRGSSGYGADFTYATRGRWGLEDYEDIMKAVDIAAQRPDVDSTRMGVTGGSYGGFMTAWITTKTNRFKAAQADRMISNWLSWYGSSDAQGLTEFEFFGKPWENLEVYEQLAPIRYVGNVRTPTLIVQSEEDHRTPMTDAEQWFTALEKQGVPVEFVRYPRSTHDLSRTGEPWLLVDRLGRLRQWFGHWLSQSAVTTAPESTERR